MIERFELTDGEKISPAWLKIEDYLKQRLQILHAALESDLAPESTAKIRGQIVEVKSLRAMAIARPVIEM